MKERYLFKSERLGFRNWNTSDVEKLTRINSNKKVMEFFPSLPGRDQTAKFVARMQKMYSEKGYCYFAVDQLEDRCFIGFIGIADQDYDSEVTPCIDIGWRLDDQYWNKGYATEGAKRCLTFAFSNLDILKIKSIAPKINLNSIHVMEKIGMRKTLEFKHPLLRTHQKLEECVCYELHSRDYIPPFHVL